MVYPALEFLGKKVYPALEFSGKKYTQENGTSPGAGLTYSKYPPPPPPPPKVGAVLTKSERGGGREGLTNKGVCMDVRRVQN